ncbi:MAG: hypothetical protein KAR08_09150, partial [Candidatus Heimdallarchaeota archaeon]|nr:hypothetical protein [Candidatus Heimdallarchaeota archaeon]
EDFSDDPYGEAATESYMNRLWFETSTESGESNFEIAGSYYCDTPGSFKTKLRSVGSPQYWYYNFSNLESFVTSWKIHTKCGNVTEATTIFLNVTNSNDQNLVQFKFTYVNEGSHPTLDWVLQLYYWSPTLNDWAQLWSEGNLYNNWYQLQFTKISQNQVLYNLSRKNGPILDSQQDSSLVNFVLSRSEGSTFSNVAYLEWRNVNNPVICPMFFWDEHVIELTPE